MDRLGFGETVKHEGIHNLTHFLRSEKEVCLLCALSKTLNSPSSTSYSRLAILETLIQAILRYKRRFIPSCFNFADIISFQYKRLFDIGDPWDVPHTFAYNASLLYSFGNSMFPVN